MQRLLSIYMILSLIYYLEIFSKSNSRVYDQYLNDLDDTDDYTHDSKYDHESFLGKDEAKEFDQYSTIEGKKRLLKLVEQIDSDTDGFVSEIELKNWIQNNTQKNIIEERDQILNDHGILADQNLTWITFRDGFVKDEKKRGENAFEINRSLESHKRRWNAADRDGDGALNKDEFLTFIHPNINEYMRNFIVNETMKDMDKNNDGFIDQEEFLKDIWVPSSISEPEPTWVAKKRQKFLAKRDKDNDGKLDKKEVEAWVVPQEQYRSDSETKYLFEKADSNKDGKLSKEEILDNYDIFVGSHATNYGEALGLHDEL